MEDVAPLEGLTIGFIGARNSTRVQVRDERPLVAFSGRESFQLARRDGRAWTIETVVERGDRELGQQTSFRLGADGRVHIAYFDVAGD